MKRSDFAAAALGLAVILPFLLSPAFLRGYEQVNADHPYLMSYLKFALLATFGECLGLRIRTGQYNRKGFGVIPRAIVWGFLGIAIKIAFVIFGEGAPLMLQTFGIPFDGIHPSSILREPGFSWLKLLSAFSVSATLNLFFAPVFMAFHRITDTHITRTGGSLSGFMTPLRVGEAMKEINWPDFWDFVLKKTIPLFWIPAQTLNFMLPENYRILVAAVYSIILGVLMSMAAMMQSRRH